MYFPHGMEYITTEIMAVLTDNDASIKIKPGFLQIQAEIQSWIFPNVSAESW